MSASTSCANHVPATSTCFTRRREPFLSCWHTKILRVHWNVSRGSKNTAEFYRLEPEQSQRRHLRRVQRGQQNIPIVTLPAPLPREESGWGPRLTGSTERIGSTQNPEQCTEGGKCQTHGVLGQYQYRLSLPKEFCPALASTPNCWYMRLRS